MANVTGWNDLMEGKIFSAVINMFDSALAGWTVAGLFFVFQIVLFQKTGSATLTWVTGFLFLSLYGTATFLKMISIQAMFVVLSIELAVILYSSFFNSN